MPENRTSRRIDLLEQGEFIKARKLILDQSILDRVVADAKDPYRLAGRLAINAVAGVAAPHRPARRHAIAVDIIADMTEMIGIKRQIGEGR